MKKYFLRYSPTREEFLLSNIFASLIGEDYKFTYKNIENIQINHKDVFLFKYRKKFILKNFKNITYINAKGYEMNINNLCYVVLKNLEIHLKNTYLHNLDGYALKTMNEVCKCCYEYDYYIDGEKYNKDTFDKHPAVKRNIRAKKLINI